MPGEGAGLGFGARSQAGGCGALAPAAPAAQSAHPLPAGGAAHILKSLLQGQADIGLDAGPFLPLPTKHFTEGWVRAGGAH